MSIALSITAQQLIASWVAMMRFLPLVGKRIEVVYRVCTIDVSIVGSLVADSGATVSLEEHFDLNGRDKTWRLMIPYHCLVRLREIDMRPQNNPQE